jgi:hypothetical protein
MTSSVSDSERIAFLICAVMVLFFVTIVPRNWFYVGDYQFHLDKSRGDFAEGDTRFETYAPLFNILATPFAFSNYSFFYLIIFMLAFATPMALFYITRNWVSVLLYFCTTNYLYFMLGQPSQALAILMMLLLFVFRNNYIRALIVLLASLAHSYGFLVCLVAFIAILIFEREEWGMVFPGCTAFFHSTRPDTVLDVPITGKESSGMTIGNIATLFTRICGLPFMLTGLQGNVMQGNWAMIVVAVFSLISSFFVSARTLYIIPLMLIPGMAIYYSAIKIRKWRLAFIALALAWGIFEFWFWADQRMWCV